MTREQIIEMMMDKANALVGNWTRAGEDEIWTMCSDWNSEHPDEEICMCERKNARHMVYHPMRQGVNISKHLERNSEQEKRIIGMIQ